MANLNNPHGFRPLMTTLTGGPPRVMEYGKPSSEGNAIASHDLVMLAATAAANDPGEGAGETGAQSAGGIQSFSQGTPGTTPILGVSLNYGAPSVESFHSVIDSPGALFEAQGDDTTSLTVAGHSHKNFNALNTGVTAPRQLSVMAIDASTAATTNTLDLKATDFYRDPANNEGAYAILMVVINKHALMLTEAAGV